MIKIMKKILLLIILLAFAISTSKAQDEILTAKGDKELSQGKYEEAVVNYTKALYKNPNNYITYYKRGNAHLYANNLDSAIADYNKFILQDTTSADAYNNRGVAYNYLGAYDMAMMDFTHAVNLDTSFVEAFVNRATAYFNIGLAPQAFSDFKKAEELKSDNPQLYYQRGRLYYYQKKYTESIEDFSKAIKLGLKNSKIYYNRGNSYFKTEQYEKAVKDYTKVLEQNPNDTEALNNRAVSYEKTDKKKLAEKDREKLKTLMVNNPDFTPFDKITFKRFEDKDKLVSIELPQNWNMVIDETPDYLDIVLTPENVKKIDDFYLTGVKVSYNKNMMKNYGVSSPDSLLDFWKGSLNKNVEEYHTYKPISQKTYPRNGFKAHTNKIIMKVSKESPTLKMYESDYAKEDNLIYLYLQAPEQQFTYYEKIFDKALETLIVR